MRAISSFFRDIRGFGLVETVITIPIFLLLTFGVVDFGNAYLIKYRLAQMTSNIAQIIKDTPPSRWEDLDPLITRSVPSNVNPANVSVAAFSSPPTREQVFDYTSQDATGFSQREWRRPAGTPTGQPHYVVVSIQHPHTYITPMIRHLLGSGTLSEYGMVAIPDPVVPAPPTPTPGSQEFFVTSAGPGNGTRQTRRATATGFSFCYLSGYQALPSGNLTSCRVTNVRGTRNWRLDMESYSATWCWMMCIR